MESPKFEKPRSWESEINTVEIDAAIAGELIDFLQSLGITTSIGLRDAIGMAQKMYHTDMADVSENTNEIIANMSDSLQSFIKNFEA